MSDDQNTPEEDFDVSAYDVPAEEDARLIELVGYLVQNIVGHPEEVEVEEFSITSVRSMACAFTKTTSGA